MFLDPNSLSEDGTVALKGVYFSNDGKYAAYSISRSGSDWQEFYVMDAATRELLEDHIVWAKFSGAAWKGDGFYYSAYDAPVYAGTVSSRPSALSLSIFISRLVTMLLMVSSGICLPMRVST